MTTQPILKSNERDALYQCIVVRLTGINDLYTAVDNGEFEVADRLSREFSDLLRLVQDLGWGDRGSEAVLTTPPDVLLRALSRLKEVAEAEDREEEVERRELAEARQRNELIRQVCDRHIVTLDALGRPGGSKSD